MLSNAIQELLVRDQFRQLSDAYPQLADPAQQQAVKDKARSLNHGEYQSLDDLIRDAARLALGDPRNTEQERRSSVSRKRSASQTRTANRKVPATALSDYERGLARFTEIEDAYGLG
jgi:Arc/MetJ-type ribon-helix-helix transcriptional regulator